MSTPTQGPDSQVPYHDPNSPESQLHAPAHPDSPAGHASGHTGHRGHGMMMVLCIIPLLAIAALVMSGTLGSGVLLWVAVCVTMMVGMMAVMMMARPGGRK